MNTKNCAVPGVGAYGAGNVKQFWAKLWIDESGQDLIEYALVAALVSLAAIASLKTMSSKIGGAFNSIGNSLSSNI